MTRLLTASIIVVVITGCGPPASQPRHDPFFDDDSPSTMTGNLDDAETRWRKEIAGERTTDPDALLTDDPPGEPERYGDVAFKEKAPTTFWGKVKVGAETVGRASFAAVSVLVTLGMMVAPYLLL
ncbi:MAG: hypothetical protein HY271_08715 [Deltaproteobacteria bacterium]|nr:hypothetical protein [Deltaproteobacteria bacterium]